MYKKIATLLVISFTFIGISFGQQAFHKSDKALNLGIGLGSGYYTGLAMAPIPSFNVSFETGVYDIPDIGVITAGGYGDFHHTWTNQTWFGTDYRDSYTNFIIGARGAFHLSMLNTDKFDVYGGILTGIRFESYQSNYYDDNNIDYEASDAYFVHDAFVGGRIMMSEKFAFFAEAGYGVSYLKAGITLKF
jgi:hypothetical protein